MRQSSVRYLILNPSLLLPEYPGKRPFCAVVSAEIAVDPVWQEKVCEWLVESGCLFALTHGHDCAAWHDSIDDAILAKHNYSKVPDNERVMTTWHEDEELSEVFWFAKHHAVHPILDLEDMIVVHVSEVENEDVIRELYAAA